MTAPTDNDSHAFADGKMRAGSLMDLSSLMLAEFREFNADAMGLSAASTANIECSVKFYDGTDRFGTNNLSATILKVDSSTGEFESSTFTASTSDSGATRKYTATSITKDQEYVLRF